MKIETMTPMEQRKDNSDGTLNPFRQDRYNMGTQIGTNVVVMFENHPDKHCPYIIIVDTMTGERLRITGFSKLEKEAYFLTYVGEHFGNKDQPGSIREMSSKAMAFSEEEAWASLTDRHVYRRISAQIVPERKPDIPA